MCGLVTVVSKQKNGMFHSDMKVFTEMLFADQLRGSDGTGIIYNKNKEIKTLKAAVASSDFVNHNMYDKAVKDIVHSGNFVVGHNRAATKGKLVHENTHPFREKHITLVHNGTLSWHKELADVEVDSHAICISMAERGLKETLKKIYGAYALIWVDNKKKTLNFIRNNQRPLYVIETKDLFIFVSEPKMAEWILDRNNQKIKSIREVPIHTLFQFEFGTWDKYEEQKIEIYTPPTFQTGNYNGKIVPYTGKKEDKLVDTNPQIGDIIEFIPVEIDAEQDTKIHGEFEDKKTGELIEVVWWTKNKEEAQAEIKEQVMEGRVSHTVHKPSTKTRYFIVTAVSKPEVVKGNLGISNNKLLIIESDFDRMSNKCSCCSVIYDKKYIKEHIKDCNFDIRHDSVSFTCPDCTDWLVNGYQNYRGV